MIPWTLGWLCLLDGTQKDLVITAHSRQAHWHLSGLPQTTAVGCHCHCLRNQKVDCCCTSSSAGHVCVGCVFAPHLASKFIPTTVADNVPYGAGCTIMVVARLIIKLAACTLGTCLGRCQAEQLCGCLDEWLQLEHAYSGGKSFFVLSLSNAEGQVAGTSTISGSASGVNSSSKATGKGAATASGSCNAIQVGPALEVLCEELPQCSGLQ